MQWKRAASAAALIALGFLGGLWLRTGLSPAESAPRNVADRPPLTGEELATIGIFEEASPSVAYFTTMALLQYFGSWNVSEIQQGTGSGFVWDDRGHVITNYHVIQNADRALMPSGAVRATAPGVEDRCG